MSKHAISDVHVELGTEEISDYVASAKLTLGKSAVDITALGEGYESYADGNVKRWAVTLELYNEYNSSEKPIYRLLKGMWTNTGAVSGTTFVMRPTSGVANRFNPQISGVVNLDGDYDFFNAVRNEANKFTVTLKGNGTPTFTDTSS